MTNTFIPTVSRHPLGSAQLLIGAFFLAGALPLCFGQANGTDIHITPRSIRTSAPSEVRPRNGVNERFNANASLVLVPVTVTDKKDHLVIGLERDNFSVFDGQERQSIRHLSNEDAPISLGIIFDSSSMYGKLERSSEAVVQFLRTAYLDDEFFLIGFADRPELLVDFTSSVEDIQDGISKVSPDGRTALLDAVYLGLDTMRQARNERKVLLIVSDGGENHSRYNIKEVWSVVKEAGVQIYAMGIFDEAPNAERWGPDLLGAISNVTGGRVFPIHSLKKIGTAMSELAIELRNQYVIAYRPSDLVHDGKWHRISVRVTPPQNNSRLRVYAKGGYYAPAE
ncbi:MAG: VWA domain-containing protein [Terriglobales bacterium]|jgi:Ca-activated chloride channel family protein